ncbi:hypothetical protein ACQYIJ_004169 [Enterobacter cloacae]
MSNIDKLRPGIYAILFRNNWDGEGDTYEAFASLDAEGVWRNEDGDELLEYQGDEVLKAWPLDDGSDVLALLDELEAVGRRIAELEAREVQLPPKAPDNLASCLDGYEKWLIATTFRDTWNACLAEVVRVNAAAGKGEAS